MNSNIEELRKRILPVLLFCQANKGDLWLYDEWKNREDAGKKLFYAYYAGLFSRVLVKMETMQVTDRDFFLHQCDLLLDKYNWYDIQDNDLEKMFQPIDGSCRNCEIPRTLEYMDEIDKEIWNVSGFKNGTDAVCLKMNGSTWSFADVRGTICSIINNKKSEQK